MMADENSNRPIDPPMHMGTRHMVEGRGVLHFSLAIAVALAFAFIGAGIAFVYMGASGDTSISFFGASFQSTNVGISAIFLGAALGVFVILRVLRTLVDLGKI